MDESDRLGWLDQWRPTTSERKTSNGARNHTAFAAAVFEQHVRIIPEGVLYVSAAHTAADLDLTRDAARRASGRIG